MDGRGSYTKVLELHKVLSELYTLEDTIPYTAIEDLITSTFGFYDQRTRAKYFEILEKGYFVTPTSKRRISVLKTITKQKSKGGISREYIRGHPYAWEKYKLARLSKSSPPPPHQSRLDDKVVVDMVTTSEEICVCAMEGEGSQSPKMGVQGRLEDDKKKEKRESSIPHTHISPPSNNVEGLAVKLSARALLQQMKEASVQPKVDGEGRP